MRLGRIGGMNEFEMIENKYGVKKEQILSIAVEKKIDEMLELVNECRDEEGRMVYEDIFYVLVKYREM